MLTDSETNIDAGFARTGLCREQIDFIASEGKEMGKRMADYLDIAIADGRKMDLFAVTRVLNKDLDQLYRTAPIAAWVKTIFNAGVRNGLVEVDRDDCYTGVA